VLDNLFEKSTPVRKFNKKKQSSLKKQNLKIKERQMKNKKILQHLTSLESKLLKISSKISPATYNTAQIRVKLALRRIIRRLVRETTCQLFQKMEARAQADGWSVNEYSDWNPDKKILDKVMHWIRGAYL